MLAASLFSHMNKMLLQSFVASVKSTLERRRVANPLSCWGSYFWTSNFLCRCLSDSMSFEKGVLARLTMYKGSATCQNYLYFGQGGQEGRGQHPVGAHHPACQSGDTLPWWIYASCLKVWKQHITISSLPSFSFLLLRAPVL